MGDNEAVHDEKQEADVAEDFEADLADEAVGDEVPEADALEQRESAGPEPDHRPPDLDREASEADVLEQAQDAGSDEDDAWT